MTSIERLILLTQEGIAGADWYEKAQNVVDRLVEQTGQPRPRVAAIIALTSPRQTLAGNLRLTLHYFSREGGVEHDSRFEGMLPSVQASIKRWEEDRSFSPRARKVKAFRDALLGNQHAVVLDTWMARALGLPYKKGSRISKAQYVEAVRRINHVAVKLNLYPCQVQAAIWFAVQPAETVRYL